MARALHAAVNWNDVRYFLEISEHGTLSAAARALRVNHATVARRLARLEKSLGITLLDRRAEGYVLTSEGRWLLRDAKAMRRAALSLQVAQQEVAEDIRGVVRITTTRALADVWLGPQLLPLQQQHPHLRIQILTGSHHFSLARREADLAIRLTRPETGNLIARRVAELRYALYASDTADNDPAYWIGYEEDSRLPEAEWLKRAAEPDAITFRSDSLLLQGRAALAGLGTALLPCYLGDNIAGLRRVPDNGPALPEREIWLAIDAPLARLSRIRRVMDYLCEAFEQSRALFKGSGQGTGPSLVPGEASVSRPTACLLKRGPP